MPDDISADALAGLLFPRKKPLARSLFDETTGEPVTVAMVSSFEFDSDALTPQSMERLDKIGDMLSLGHLSEETLVVEGHTDVTGSEEYNLGLSKRRALSVKNYLVRDTISVLVD